MIPQSITQVDPFSLIKHKSLPNDWRAQMREAYRTPTELLTALDFSPEQQVELSAHDQGFMTLVPRAFAQKMRPQDPTDPLLLQVLPQAQEAISHAEFNNDPLEEARFNPVPGVVHKYHGRAL
ncbi:EF-P beta-lysylation protein EpmB, partial [Oceanospirillaceae bacterium]|nr:EF-P beta-lysylation protein EpmB [Oceanospirillaceae bacterium]